MRLSYLMWPSFKFLCYKPRVSDGGADTNMLLVEELYYYLYRNLPLNLRRFSPGLLYLFLRLSRPCASCLGSNSNFEAGRMTPL